MNLSLSKCKKKKGCIVRVLYARQHKKRIARPLFYTMKYCSICVCVTLIKLFIIHYKVKERACVSGFSGHVMCTVKNRKKLTMAYTKVM